MRKGNRSDTCAENAARISGSGGRDRGRRRKEERKGKWNGVSVVEEGIGELASAGIEGRQGEGRGARRGERGLIDLRKQVD